MGNNHYEPCHRPSDQRSGKGQYLNFFLGRIMTKFRNLITQAHFNIINQTLEFLIVKTPKTPTALPKIHKSLIQAPGRPSVSGNACLTDQQVNWLMIIYVPMLLPSCHIFKILVILSGPWIMSMYWRVHGWLRWMLRPSIT